MLPLGVFTVLVRSTGPIGWVVGQDVDMTDAPAELVHYAVADHVATITLDSPANRNALSRQLVTELFAHLEARAPTTPSGWC